MKGQLIYLLIAMVLFCSCHSNRPFVGLDKKSELFERYEIQSIFNADSSSHVYDVHIFVQKKQLSGLLFCKLVDEKHRFSMMTKTGQKLLDISLWEDEMIVHHAMSQLNKKVILQQLKNDFQLLFMSCDPKLAERVDLFENETIQHFRFQRCSSNSELYQHYLFDKSTGQLTKVAFGKKQKLKRWAEFKDYDEDLSRHITIDHRSFINLRLELYALELN